MSDPQSSSLSGAANARPLTAFGPRVAVGAFMLETNTHSPIATREEFDLNFHLCDQEFEQDWRLPAPRSPGTVKGFVRGMDQQGPWQAVPLLGAAVGASGCVDQSFFNDVVDGVCRRLKAAGPLDGVFLSLHGAAVATEDPDPEGTLLERVREVVGADMPVVCTLDLHGNIVARMVNHASVMIAYRTNPHVDTVDRGLEAAAVMREMLAGMKPTAAFVKVPMTPPSVTQNTDKGPYADLIGLGQRLVDSDVVNVSILSGFTLGDTPRNGLCVIVTTRNHAQKAQALACQLASKAWDERHRWVPHLTALPQAQRMALACGNDPSLPAVLFADVADNAGGGGRANTVWILQAFVQAGVTGCALGIFYDPALAATAHRLGVGAVFQATFNSQEDHPLSGRFEHEAQVVALHDGRCTGRRGVAEGQTVWLGPTTLLQVGGVQVVVVSVRQQCKDPVFFEMVGVDLSKVRSLIVKSRGHFRAGFDEFFSDEHIVEVDVPGLTTPVLSQVKWERMPRPMFPLDPDMSWTPPDPFKPVSP